MSKVHTTALAFVPADAQWEPIQALRHQHDKQVRRWPPHVNLLYPFVEQSEFAATAARLRRALQDVRGFDACLVSVDHFSHGRSCTAYLRPAPSSVEALRAVQAACVSAVPQCNDLNERGSEGFVPHLTVGQFDSEDEVLQFRASTPWAPLVVRVAEVVLLSRAGPHDPFRVLYRVPLGGGEVVCAVPKSVADPTAARAALLQLVTGGLLREPSFDRGDAKALAIGAAVTEVAGMTPEFVLKLAVYVRDDLGIRATAGYLLALAAQREECRPFLRKYMPAAVRLPNDLCQVVSFYRQLQLAAGAPAGSGGMPPLNAALRKALALRLPAFSTYQLGKYNNEKAVSRQRARSEGAPVFTPSLKELVRLLHLGADPDSVFHVMCILGKRYPATAEAFAASRLPGLFDPEQAGKRMRLPVPETWETQISARGNSAEVWQSLLDNNALPYMAMLRNLRNLLQAGISNAHHKRVLRRLCDPRAVRNSRQFPFRFFSAYDALEAAANPQAAAAQGKRSAKAQAKAVAKAATLARVPARLLDEYRVALDTAVKLATTFNLEPIHGSTVVMVDVGATMRAGRAGQSRSGASSKISHDQMALLMGLMFQYACESSRFVLFDSDQGGFVEVPPLDLSSALLQRVAELQAMRMERAHGDRFPAALLNDLLLQRSPVDNLVVLSHTRSFPGLQRSVDLLRELREDMLFVSVDVVGENVGTLDAGGSKFDVAVSGCSDALLRFVAERGGSAQLEYVERIDEVKALSSSSSSSFQGALPELRSSPGQKEREDHEDDEDDDDDGDSNEGEAEEAAAKEQLRIFVSSTFLDMWGERDLMQRVVLPELQRRCHTSGRDVQLLEVDLRWGITAREAERGAATPVGRCLEEVAAADIFVGFLGQRYGWVPPAAACDTELYPELRGMPGASSVTEMEVELGALSPDARAAEAFLYLRAPVEGLPSGQPARTFGAESPAAAAAMRRLKLKTIAMAQAGRGRVHASRYWCNWGGRDGVAGLEALQARLLEDLWEAVQRLVPPVADLTSASALRAETAAQLAFEAGLARGFVGHAGKLRRMHGFACGAGASSVLLLQASAGAGSTALLCRFAQEHRERFAGDAVVLTAYAGCTPRSGNLLDSLLRLCSTLRTEFGLNQDEPLPVELAKLRALFPELLEAAASTGRRVVLALDAGDGYQPMLDLLPTRNHAKVRVVVSTPHATRRMAHVEEVGGMDPETAAEMVRTYLAQFGKKLDESSRDNQMRSLLRKAGATHPLYLRLACDVLRARGSFDRLSQQITSLPADLSAIVKDVVYSVEREHGRQLVEATLVPLALTRAGLSERELLRLNTSLAKWLPLRSAVAPFLREDSTLLMQFRSARVARAFADEYARYPNQAARVHKRLAHMFCGEGSSRSLPRDCTEGLYHALQAGEHELLVGLLCDLRFVKRMIDLGALFALVDAYAEAGVALARQPQKLRRRVAAFGRFVSRNALSLARRPELLFQLAANSGGEIAAAAAAVAAPEGADWIEWGNRDDQDQVCAFSAAPSAGAILGCAADETRVALAMADWSVVLLSVPAGGVLSMLRGHTNRVNDVALCGDTVLSASADKTLRVWGAGTEVVLTGHSKAVNACDLSPTGDLAVSGADDNTVRLWNLLTGKPAGEFAEHAGPVTSVAFHASGNLFVSGSWDKTVIVWHRAPSGWAVYKRLPAGVSAVQAAVMSPALTKLVGVCSFDGSVRVLDVDAEQVLCEYPRFSPSPTASCAFAANGGLLASVSGDGAMRVFTVSSVGRHVASFSEHSGAGKATAFLRGSDDSLVTAGADGHVKLWCLPARLGLDESASSLYYRVNAMAVTEGDRVFAALDSGRVAKLAAAGTGDVRHLRMGGDGLARAVAASPRYLAAADESFGVVLALHSRALAVLEGHTNAVSALAFSPDQRLLASGSWDRSVRVWRVGDETLERVISVDDNVTALAFVDSERLLVATRTGAVAVFVAATGARALSLGGHQAGVTGAALSPSGALAATACRDRVGRVFRLDTGREVAAVGAGGASPATAVAFFSNDVVAFGHLDGRVAWWRLPSAAGGDGEATKLGEFVCGAAVASMVRVSPTSHVQPDKLVVADRQGRVYDLAPSVSPVPSSSAASSSPPSASSSSSTFSSSSTLSFSRPSSSFSARSASAASRGKPAFTGRVEVVAQAEPAPVAKVASPTEPEQEPEGRGSAHEVVELLTSAGVLRF